MRKLVPMLLLGVACLPVAASDPGQPLDCSDFVIEQKGITCVEVVPYPCADPDCGLEKKIEIAEKGHAPFNRGAMPSSQTRECCPKQFTARHSFDRGAGPQKGPNFHIEDRCGGLDTIDRTTLVDPRRYLTFDIAAGRLFAVFESSCVSCGGTCQYESGRWLAAFDGIIPPVVADSPKARAETLARLHGDPDRFPLRDSRYMTIALYADHRVQSEVTRIADEGAGIAVRVIGESTTWMAVGGGTMASWLKVETLEAVGCRPRDSDSPQNMICDMEVRKRSGWIDKNSVTPSESE